MKKRTVRAGLRCILAAMVLVLVSTHFHEIIAQLFLLDGFAEMRLVQLGLFWAAMVGGYGVVVMVLGLILRPEHREDGIALKPLVLFIGAALLVFIWLSFRSLSGPEPVRRLRPGETITISNPVRLILLLSEVWHGTSR